MILDEFSPHTLLGFAEFLRNPKRAKLQQSGFPIKQKKKSSYIDFRKSETFRSLPLHGSATSATLKQEAPYSKIRTRIRSTAATWSTVWALEIWWVLHVFATKNGLLTNKDWGVEQQNVVLTSKTFCQVQCIILTFPSIILTFPGVLLMYITGYDYEPKKSGRSGIYIYIYGFMGFPMLTLPYLTSPQQWNTVPNCRAMPGCCLAWS